MIPVTVQKPDSHTEEWKIKCKDNFFIKKHKRTGLRVGEAGRWHELEKAVNRSEQIQRGAGKKFKIQTQAKIKTQSQGKHKGPHGKLPGMFDHTDEDKLAQRRRLNAQQDRWTEWER